MSHYLTDLEYKEFIKSIKQNIISARQKAIKSVNTELIVLYFNIGKEIVSKQKISHWGDDLIGQIEKDLKADFQDLTGFSRTNLFYMKKFFLFFEQNGFVPQTVGQIPWGHIRLILDKIKDINEALFYVKETIENSWSRVILDHQIDLKLYSRQGKLPNNFKVTINDTNIELIENCFKESYILDFLNLSKQNKESDLEKALINNITTFLMELGKGFAFVGKQYKLIVGNKEFFIDLLFYNYILKRFIVIELKTCEFKPEHFGQISFYVTAVDNDIKRDDDKETIGLLICKSKDTTVVEYALSNNKKPLGVAEYKFTQLNNELIAYLPSELELVEILKNN